jgi:hypothetical protein
VRKERQAGLETLVEGLGEAMAEITKAERAKWATADTELVARLEKRIKALERRLVKAEKRAAEPTAPRLIRHV